MARILFSTVGTLGDLHPSLAIARELLSRGHSPVIASHPNYRARVEAAGLSFHPVRPDLGGGGDMAAVMKQAMHETRGSEYVVLGLIIPHLRDSFEDLMRASEHADAIVTHTLSFAGAVVAEKRRLPRIGVILQPQVTFSAYDPPYSPALPGSAWLRTRGPLVWKVLWRMARMSSRRWFREVDALRAEAGLPRSKAHPLFDSHSSLLNLVLFPSVLAQPRPDWPPNTVVAGLCLYDRDERGAGLPDSARRFLESGPPPIVFSLGSSGVWTAEGFYQSAAEAAAMLGRRAVLLTGPIQGNRPASLGADVLAIEYASHSELFPRAAANVHHGGIGTTGQALRAGRPMVVVPFSHDQPDNGARCERLGVARVVPRRAVSAAALAAALRDVLEDPAVAARAAEVGERVRRDGGAPTAADAIERALGLDRANAESSEVWRRGAAPSLG